jgi:hypothetical protein
MMLVVNSSSKADNGNSFGFDPLRNVQTDDVHSFVVRVHMNPAPGGRGTARPQFTLEHVNHDAKIRMKNQAEVLKELSIRIDEVLHGF